jgi:tetratricopeptide (TPR) repeat protein
MARRFMQLGDEYFRAGRYTLAYDRYRSAGQAAPRLGDAYLRQGFALAANGRYEAAAREIKRGLERDPNLTQSDLRLSDLYGDKSKAKTAHLDAMAKAADGRFAGSDLLFLIGVYLHFDGQEERAKPFFQRAAQVAGGKAAHLEAFLHPPKPVEP